MSVEVNGERIYTGRKIIKTDAEVITRDNLLNELTNALTVHRQNVSDIKYLYDYYRGVQDVLYKVKPVRPEINNKVTVNVANEIVSFKVGYLVGEPIQYISTEDADKVEKVMEEVAKLNKGMNTIGKHKLDKELIEWMMICGTGYRYIASEKNEDVPFNLYTLDPRNTTIVYSSGIKQEPIFAFTSYLREGTTIEAPNVNTGLYTMEIYEVFTPTTYFKVVDGKIVKEENHYLGTIPIIEYSANKARLGAFEVVLPLLNALNAAYSDRMDAVAQYVNSFLKFINCDVDEDAVNMLKQFGAIKIVSEKDMPADVELISQEMSQDQTQTLIDSIKMEILTITGLPNRSGGTGSTSDTGKATIYRDGFNDALARARDTETEFKASENKMLKVLLKLCKANNYCDLKVQDIQPDFTIHNYDDIQSKAQVLIALLQNDKVHPKLAFTSSGLFVDPESAYKMSMEHYEEVKKENEEKALQIQNRKVLSDNEQGSSDKNANSKTMSNPVEKFAEDANYQRVNS